MVYFGGSFVAVVPNLDLQRIATIQFASSVPGRFRFYAMIWRYFDLIKVPLKVMLPSCSSGSNLILFRAFQRCIISSFWSRGIKVITPQSWRSWKKNGKILQLTFYTRFYLVNCCSPSDPGSIPGRRKLWRPTFLRILGLKGQKLIFLRDLIYFY